MRRHVTIELTLVSSQSDRRCYHALVLPNAEYAIQPTNQDQATNCKPMHAKRKPLATCLISVAIVSIGACSSMPASAETAPTGSYQRTCQDTKVERRALVSKCSTRAGQLRETRLEDFRECIGDIGNAAGTLSCSKGVPAPVGEYERNCRDSFVSGNTLHSMCQTRSGIWNQSVLPDVNHCLGAITNVDGQLQCNKGGTPPAGTYAKTCRDSYVSAMALHTSCKTAAGIWQLTQLDNFRRCHSDIVNLNGRLECATEPSLASVPEIEDCREIEINGNVLSATCKTVAGRWQPTFLSDPETCHGPVHNGNGRLDCERGNPLAPRNP